MGRGIGQEHEERLVGFLLLQVIDGFVCDRIRIVIGDLDGRFVVLSARYIVVIGLPGNGAPKFIESMGSRPRAWIKSHMPLSDQDRFIITRFEHFGHRDR